MKTAPQDSLSVWIARHAFLVWLGIFLNLLLIVPLFFYPEWVLGLFHLPLDQTIWARFAAGLLMIISIFYIPATIDIDRYRVFAWLAILPSRTFGAMFFFVAVFLFGEPPGFIVAILLDGCIGLATLICLLKITALERQLGLSGGMA